MRKFTTNHGEQTANMDSLSANPFLALDEYVFQRACRDILQSEPEHSSGEVYGMRGQSQHGVDVWSAIRNGDSITVGQCKRYKKFTKGDVEYASLDFFEFWDAVWKKRHVKRFVLFVACDVSDAKVQAEIFRQREIFRKRGLGYEVWGYGTLQGKVMPNRHIIQNHYGADAADLICGPISETPESHAAQRFFNRRIGLLITELETTKVRELEELRELSREGKHSEALAGILKLRKLPVWNDFSNEVKARCLRFEATARLNMHESAPKSRDAAAEARQLHPDGDYETLDAFILYRENKAEEALALISSPKSIEAKNLRWGLLLEQNKFEPVLAEIATESQEILTADSWRLWALASLAAGDQSAARERISQAIRLKENHHGVRVARAVINYHQSITTLKSLRPILSWPVPMDWVFVKRDTASAKLLRDAEIEFGRFVAESVSDAERCEFEIWKLACLANDETRRVEAREFAKQLLATNPGNFRAVSWAVERGLMDDYTSLEATLAEQAKASKAPLDLFLAWTEVLLAQERFEDAENALRSGEEVFRENGSNDIWLAQLAQLVAQRNDEAEAKKLVAGISNPETRRHAELALLKVGKSDLPTIAAQFEEDYRKTGAPQALFKCCAIRCRLNEWAFISEHAENLVVMVGTQAALRLALEGSFHNENYALCLKLLREHRSLLPGSELSSDLQSLQLECQFREGYWQQAITDAESRYRTIRDVATFTDWFRVLVETADLCRAAIAARELLSLEKCAPQLLFQAASVCRLENPELAKELWRRGLDPTPTSLPLQFTAVTLAFQLGTEREAGPLIQELFKHAQRGSGPIQTKTLEEMIVIIEENQQEQNRMGKLYDESAAPIHLIADQAGLPLVAIYHQRLEDNRRTTNLTRVAPVLTRYGGAVLPTKVAREPLIADLTGIILAADLGVLELIEKKLGPIRIAAGTTRSLMEQAAKVAVHQPSQQEWRKQLLAAVDRSEIKVLKSGALIDSSLPQNLGKKWIELYQAALEQDGVLVAAWPVTTADRKFEAVDLPLEAAARTFNQRELFRALEIAGAITEAKYEAALIPGSAVTMMPERTPDELQWAKRRPVMLEDSVPAALIEAGFLAEATRQFLLYVSDSAVAEARDEVANFARRKELSEWTMALLDRIQRGVANGTYEILPTQPLGKHNKAILGLDGTNLGTLVESARLSKDGALWCDDRMINRHLRAGTRSIICIAEVLLMLRGTGALTEAAYFEKLALLRSGNARYYPVTSAEIMYHLRQARVDGRGVVETSGLAVLRRYTNACMLDRERLLRPVDHGQHKDLREWEFPLQLRQSTDEALRMIWEHETESESTRIAQADWLWSNLYVDLLTLRQAIVGDRQPNEEQELSALVVGSLYSIGLHLPHKHGPGSIQSSCSACYNWLNKRVLEPLTKANPEFIDLVANEISRDIIQITQGVLKDRKKLKSQAKVALVQKLLICLPNSLLNKLQLPKDLASSLKIRIHGPTVQFEGGDYDQVEFWRAVAEAYNGRRASVTSRDGHRKLDWAQRIEKGSIGVRSTDSFKEQVIDWWEPEFSILVDDASARLKFLCEYSQWFDCPKQEHTLLRQEIASLKYPHERFRRLQDLRASAPVLHYERLLHQFQTGHSIDPELLHPDWARLRGHLRLDGTESGDLAAGIGETLLREIGLEQTLMRMIFLPIRLPANVEKAWKDSSTGAADLDRLRKMQLSPLADLHLIRLALLRPDISADAKITLVAEWFFEGKDDLVKSFLSVLKWAHGDFARWTNGRKLPAREKLILIWYHAARIHGIFRAHGGDLAKIETWFKQQAGGWRQDVLYFDPAVAMDASNPVAASHGHLQIRAMVNALSDLPPETVAILDLPSRLAAFIEADTSRSVEFQIDLMRRNDLGTDVLGSLLQAPTTASYEALLGRILPTHLLPQNTDESISQWITKLPDPSFDRMSWIFVIAALRELPPTEKQLVELRSSMLEVDFVKFIGLDAAWGGVGLTFAAGLTHWITDGEYRARLDAQIKATILSVDQSKLAESGPSNEVTAWLLQAVLNLCRVPEDESNTAARYFMRLSEIVKMQPEFGKLLRPSIDFWLLNLPLAQRRSLGPLNLAARAAS